MLSISLKKSDLIGALSSGLCMIHCIATPFFFIASVCGSSSCSISTPLWWRFLDYIFLFVSSIAIYQSTKTTNSNLIRYYLWLSWLALAFTIINGQVELLLLSEYIKFVPAFILIGLHGYNYKFCRCAEDECCY